MGYIEAYFDHARWGEETLGVLAAEGALRDPALADVNLVRIEEQAPLDVTGGGQRDYRATNPPSTGSTTPVM